MESNHKNTYKNYFNYKLYIIINNFKERCFFKYSEVEIVPLVNNLFDKAVNSWRTTQYDYFQKLTNGIQM